MRLKTLNIPVEVLEHVLKNRETSHFKVYLAMRALYESYIYKKDVDYQALCDLTGFSSIKTVKKHIQTCLKENLIGENDHSYFLRSTKYLKQKYGVESRTNYKIDLTSELPNLDEMSFAVVVSHLVKRRKRKGSNTRGQKQIHYYELGEGEKYTAHTLSLRFLAQRFGVSHTMIHRWKTKAIKLGYIIRKKCSHYVSKAEHAFLYAFKETYDRLFTHKHKVYLRLTDEIYGKVRFVTVK